MGKMGRSYVQDGGRRKRAGEKMRRGKKREEQSKIEIKIIFIFIFILHL